MDRNLAILSLLYARKSQGFGIRLSWLATQSHWASRLIQVSVEAAVVLVGLPFAVLFRGWPQLLQGVAVAVELHVMGDSEVSDGFVADWMTRNWVC